MEKEKKATGIVTNKTGTVLNGFVSVFEVACGPLGLGPRFCPRCGDSAAHFDENGDFSYIVDGDAGGGRYRNWQYECECGFEWEISGPSCG